MFNVTIEQLLEAGVHFGHQKSRWHPNMRPYIFGVRNGIHIIDLRKTLEALKNAYDVLKNYASRGESVLFVGTKKQIKDIVSQEAQRAGAFWTSERWLGGMLTNFRTVRQSVQHMRQVEKMMEDGTFEKLTKKEANIIKKRYDKLNSVLRGVRDMERLPGIIFVVDIVHEKTAVLEAQKLGIPVIGICDTNADPQTIAYPIPGNDDAIKSVQVIVSTMADAVSEGRAGGISTTSFTKTEISETKEGEVIEEEMRKDTLEEDEDEDYKGR